MWPYLKGTVDSNSFIIKSYLPLLHRDSSTHMHGFWVYIKEGYSLAWEISLETFDESYLCILLAFLYSVLYLFFLYQSSSLPLCLLLDAVSTNTDRALSEDPLVNVFVFK